MCGRFTDMYTWEQLWRLYMLSVGFPQSNMQPNYNHCPPDPTNTILLRDGKRVFELLTHRRCPAEISLYADSAYHLLASRRGFYHHQRPRP